MLRIAACLLCIVLSASKAVASCAEEVIAAWRQLHAAGPYTFTITSSGNTLSGVVDRPRALRHWRDDGKRRYEWVRIGSRQWTFQDGRWYDAGEILPPLSPPIEQDILGFERLFNFEAEQLAKQIQGVACLGRVIKDGREYTGYDYRVRRGDGALFIREKLYIDTTTGLPAQQEHEQRQNGPQGPFGPTVRRKAEFRFDASIKIEPPVPFPR
jgi:hypothetical protein